LTHILPELSFMPSEPGTIGNINDRSPLISPHENPSDNQFENEQMESDQLNSCLNNKMTKRKEKILRDDWATES
jgi:hypothetical protein